MVAPWRAPARRDYEVAEPGFKFAMNDISAAVGIHQLARLDGWIERRAELADLYDAALAGLPLELPPRPPAHARHAHHLYIVRLRRRRSDRSRRVAQRHAGAQHRLQRALQGDPPVPLLPRPLGLEPGDLPGRRDLSAPPLSLPLFPAMTEADVDDVAYVAQLRRLSRVTALPHPRAACRSSALGAAAPAPAEAALKAMWGPSVMPDGSSAFPIYKDLGVDVIQEQLSWRDVADQPARRRRATRRIPLTAGRLRSTPVVARRDGVRHQRRAAWSSGPRLGTATAAAGVPTRAARLRGLPRRRGAPLSAASATG